MFEVSGNPYLTAMSIGPIPSSPKLAAAYSTLSFPPLTRLPFDKLRPRARRGELVEGRLLLFPTFSTSHLLSFCPGRAPNTEYRKPSLSFNLTSYTLNPEPLPALRLVLSSCGVDLSRRLVGSTCPVVARRAKQEARRAKQEARRAKKGTLNVICP